MYNLNGVDKSTFNFEDALALVEVSEPVLSLVTE